MLKETRYNKYSNLSIISLIILKVICVKPKFNYQNLMEISLSMYFIKTNKYDEYANTMPNKYPIHNFRHENNLQIRKFA